MIGQFETRRNSASFHATFQFRQEEAAPPVVTEKMIAEIRRAIRPQVESVGIGLLDLTEALSGQRTLKFDEE